MTPFARNIERLRMWNHIYATERMRWGTQPSLAATLTTGRLPTQRLPAGLIVDFGCGYGRDLRLLSEAYPSSPCFGIEGASSVADLWQELAPVKASAVPMKAECEPAIKLCDIFALDEHFGFKDTLALAFSNYFFHLLEMTETAQLMGRVGRALAKGAFFAGSFVSTQDVTFGKYEGVGRNRQQMEDGIWQYFEEAEVRDLVEGAQLDAVFLERFEELELKRGREDRVNLIYVIGRKR